MDYVLLDGLSFKINKVTDLEGDQKEMPDENMKATYSVKWSGEKGESAHFINRESEQPHHGMSTSRIKNLTLEDNVLTIETLNSFYYLDLIKYDESLDAEMKEERKYW